MDFLADVSNKKLRQEFVRALQTIETTQLTTFRETLPPPRADLLRSFKSTLDSRASELPPEELQITIMRDLLATTINTYNDPYANYITPEALLKYQQRRKGNFVGIGVKFRARKDEYPVIIGALTGGPLEHADLQPGDKIISIEGKDQKAATAKEVTGLLKGAKDSSVHLVLQRGDSHSVEILAKRSPVKLLYVRSDMLDAESAYLKVSRFGANSHKTLALQIDQLLSRGAKGFILDLRDNPGGSTRAARAMVSMFSDASWVYCEQLKSGITRRLPRHGKRLTSHPLVLLINEKSMSSSEIVAGALKAHQGAVIVGAPTYGKGLIQRVFNLKPPLGGAVRATIAAYATPDDLLIHGVGVVPDLYVKSASHGQFRETGSLNINAEAREFKRQLLEEELTAKYPEEAPALISMQDEQLEAAKVELRQLMGL